jgi:hypothetical protein
MNRGLGNGLIAAVAASLLAAGVYYRKTPKAPSCTDEYAIQAAQATPAARKTVERFFELRAKQPAAVLETVSTGPVTSKNRLLSTNYHSVVAQVKQADTLSDKAKQSIRRAYLAIGNKEIQLLASHYNIAVPEFQVDIGAAATINNYLLPKSSHEDSMWVAHNVRSGKVGAVYVPISIDGRKNVIVVNSLPATTANPTLNFVLHEKIHGLQFNGLYASLGVECTTKNCVAPREIVAQYLATRAALQLAKPHSANGALDRQIFDQYIASSRTAMESSVSKRELKDVFAYNFGVALIAREAQRTHPDSAIVAFTRLPPCFENK